MSDHLLENLRGMCAFARGRGNECAKLEGIARAEYCTPCEAAARLEALMPAVTAHCQDQSDDADCVAHVLSQGGDMAGEGYILTTDDRMYWENVYASLASRPDGPESEEEA